MSEEDSSPIVHDPLRNIAEPDEPIRQTYEGQEEEIPADIREFLEVNGINERQYRCSLKRVPDGLTDPARAAYINTWINAFPTIEYVAREYGPGEYQLLFQWRCKDPETQRLKSYMKPTTMIIDEYYQDVYEENQLQKAIKRSERQKKMVQHAQIKNEIGGGMLAGKRPGETIDKMSAGKEYIREVVESANALGLTSKKSFDWDKIMSVALPLLPILLKSFTERSAAESEKIEKIYTLLLSQQSESNKQLLELMKSQHGPTTGNDMMKEMRDMIFSAVDIKEALHGNKQTIADKIFDLVQGIAPQVVELAMKNQSARELDPRYSAAKAYMALSPDFKELKADPQAQVELINRLDKFFGWEQTDIILKVGGIERTEANPRDPSRRYAMNDPRNAASESSVSEAVVVENEQAEESE